MPVWWYNLNMSNPDTISINVVSDIDEVIISPISGVESVDVNTVSEETNVTIDTSQNIDTVVIEQVVESLQVELAVVDTTTGVFSVNGKSGHVTIDYPDINTDPVNHVKYMHTQNAPSTQWNITHNLGFFPNVTVLDNENRVIEADIQYLNINSVRIVMNVALSGVAYLT
jgi:hypothetical protein